MQSFLQKLKYSIKAKLLQLLYFKTEQQLLAGRFRGNEKLPPVLLLTVHKAASSLLSVRLSSYFSKHGYAIADISSFFAKTGLKKRDAFLASEEQRKKVFCSPGVFHCAIRWEVEIPCPQQTKIILVLRDPRDVLVSHYYSTKFSHPVLNPDFYAFREKAGHLNIDEYVKWIAPDFRNRYQHYLKMIRSQNVLFLKYESLITEPEKFEKQIADFVSLPLSAGEIVNTSDFAVSKEDPSSHKRQVKSGDHKNKLQPETIEWLTAYFGELMKELGY